MRWRHVLESDGTDHSSTYLLPLLTSAISSSSSFSSTAPPPFRFRPLGSSTWVGFPFSFLRIDVRGLLWLWRNLELPKRSTSIDSLGFTDYYFAARWLFILSVLSWTTSLWFSFVGFPEYKSKLMSFATTQFLFLKCNFIIDQLYTKCMHVCTPRIWSLSLSLQFKISKGVDVIRTDIQVGDDTRSRFTVFLWQKPMGSMAMSGDVILLQSKSY